MENSTTPIKQDALVVVTGAAGFIGSCMVQYLNEQGYENLVLADDFGVEKKRKNWESKKFAKTVERHYLIEWLNEQNSQVGFFIHLGARTDTTEFDYAIHEELNLNYSRDVWNYCVAKNVPLIYASSAATYGGGEHGYYDSHEVSGRLHPLNPYGISKNEFDKWAIQQKKFPPFWAGLKFFNVYGPNEYHKGRMASVVYHAYQQIKKDGQVKLFRSHKEGVKDGEQLRDFIYVKDVVKIIYWLVQTKVENGIYNVGTGKARSFNDLVYAVFAALNKKPQLVYVDMPQDIREKYQYFTEANMLKLHNAGYNEHFFTLEEGVQDYVRNYLEGGKTW